jgi:CO/xanthine dehydrogenase FAD-binding subunit
MKPAPFTYHDPATTAEAVAVLASHENARPLAGGQSLVPMMNFRYAAPDHLVDLNGIESLRGLEVGARTSTCTWFTLHRSTPRALSSTVSSAVTGSLRGATPRPSASSRATPRAASAAGVTPSSSPICRAARRP